MTSVEQEKKGKLNLMTWFLEKPLSTKNKPSNYLMPPSSWIDIESTDTFLSGLGNE